MSIENPAPPPGAASVVPTPTATAPPASLAAPAAPLASPPASPAAAVASAPPAAGASSDPPWLPDRLERERRAILRELGVEDLGNAKAALADLKKRQDSEKTELERMRGETETLRAQVARVADLEKAVKAQADTAIAQLTPEQRNAVASLAGEDPARIVSAIAALQPTWAPALVPAAPGAVAKPPVPPPASTSAAGGAPPPAGPTSVDHKTVYASLQKSNPLAAASYASRYDREIFGTG